MGSIYSFLFGIVRLVSLFYQSGRPTDLIVGGIYTKDWRVFNSSSLATVSLHVFVYCWDLMASSDDILMESEPEHHGSRNELSNSDQMSLMNIVIDRALERQRKILIDHIDSKLDTVNRPVPATVEEFDFRQEGNKIQHKFNSQRSGKLSEVLRLIQSGHNEDTEDVVKSEISEIRQRNKLIKIADRHGWDTVREYPLADDNEDATKLRTAIARASRKRNVSKPYDRKPPIQPNQGYGGFAGRQNSLFRAKVQPKDNSAIIFAPGSCATCPDTLQSIAHTTAASSQQGPQRQQPQPPVQLTQVKPPSNNVVTNEVEYLNCSDYVQFKKTLTILEKYFACNPIYR